MRDPLQKELVKQRKELDVREIEALMKVMDVVQQAYISLSLHLPIENDQGVRIDISRSPEGPVFFAQQQPGSIVWRVHPDTGKRVVGVKYTSMEGFEVFLPDGSKAP